MNIWQVIIVFMAVFRLGIGVMSSATSKKWKGKRPAAIVGDLIYFSASIFVLYKAGVLIINI